MYNKEHWQEQLADVLTETFRREVVIKSLNAVGGGSINRAYSLVTNIGNYFVKANNLPDSRENFIAESAGLELLRQNCQLTVPEVFGLAASENYYFLVMELLGQQPRSSSYWHDLGIGLAELHQKTNKQYGLDSNNFIGSLRQFNTEKNTWAEFFIEQRLDVQIKLALDNGLLSKYEAKMFDGVKRSLVNMIPEEKPALVHGDLWGGNIFRGNSGEAALIDPAVYYGHREMDISFTHMFGGFDRQFYESYQEAYALEPGFSERVDVHNLYPSLVHLNLFGRSYWSQIKQTLDRFR